MRSARRALRNVRAGGITLLLISGMASAGCSRSSEPTLRIRQTETTLDVERTKASGEAVPVLRYCYAGVPFKPYVQEFRTPAGVNILRDNVADHLHHHGLMFAVRVDDVDTWPETKGCGAQVQRDLVEVRAVNREGTDQSSFTQHLDWQLAGGGEVKLQEQRTIIVYHRADLPVSLLTWESILTAPQGSGPVVLGGSDYYGLGARFVPSMDEVGRFTNADGKTDVAGTNGARAAWCAYTAPADGRQVTVAVFDHPANPRHPCTWFTMKSKFAYISATLNLKKEPFTLAAGQSIRLCYAMAVWDGEADVRTIESVYRRWLECTRSDLKRAIASPHSP